MGSSGEGFWLWPRRRGRSIPAAGCDGRVNARRKQKTRRPEGFRTPAGFVAPRSQTPGRYARSSRLAIQRTKTEPHGILKQALGQLWRQFCPAPAVPQHRQHRLTQANKCHGSNQNQPVRANRQFLRRPRRRRHRRNALLHSLSFTALLDSNDTTCLSFREHSGRVQAVAERGFGLRLNRTWAKMPKSRGNPGEFGSGVQSVVLLHFYGNPPYILAHQWSG